jgi:hypothetical protein
MTAIMMGGSSFTQLFFAPVVSNVRFKKKYLLTGINTRVFSLLALAAILFWLARSNSPYILWFIFLFISIFSFSGAFTNISYVDILGKSIKQESRKSFFSTKQIVGGVIVLSTAFLAKKVLSANDFPVNYSSTFLIGGLALLIASAGFWRIKETEPSGTNISGINDFLKSLVKEIKSNRRLIYFLGLINTQGIVISFIPFVMLYAKETFLTEGSDTGIFLLFKVIGVVSIGLIVLALNKRIKYNYILYLNVLLSICLAVFTLTVKDVSVFRFIFILGGIVVSLYSISMNGVLLEVSTNDNRSLYTGFTGAGNIVPAIFPLISGLIIEKFGFNTFFVLFILIIASSVFFIYRIRCTR